MKVELYRFFRDIFGIAFRILSVLGALFSLSCLTAEGLQAAAIATVGQDDGYSGRILDKIAAKWKPPKQLIGTHKLKIILSLDGDGKLLDCRIQKASGLEALDVSACAAARAAAPFGSPPYGMPATVYFSFWTGGLDSRVPVQDEKEQVNTAYAERAAENARFANERAQARAQAAAKSSGKQLPGEQGAVPAGKNTDKKQNVKTAEKASAVAPEPPKAKTAEKAAAPIPVPKSNKVSSPEAGEQKVQNAPNSYHYRSKEKYISKITWDLRNAMYVPIQSKPGVYHATVRVECDKAGNITSSEMLNGSGDELIDKYVMQGIERAKKIIPPAEEYGNTFDLTFKMVRQAKAKKKPVPAPNTIEINVPENTGTE